MAKRQIEMGRRTMNVTKHQTNQSGGTARTLFLFSCVFLGFAVPCAAQNRPQVRAVATLPTYAAIIEEVAGDLARVDYIARGDEDPHFVNPRPSFAAIVQRADLFVVTGLDLELWVPALLDRANNPKVVEGGPGHVVAYSGVKLLEVPENVPDWP